MNYVDDLLRIEDKAGLTPLADINSEVRAAGQLLINHFVRVQGLAVSQVGPGPYRTHTRTTTTLCAVG